MRPGTIKRSSEGRQLQLGRGRVIAPGSFEHLRDYPRLTVVQSRSSGSQPPNGALAQWHFEPHSPDDEHAKPEQLSSSSQPP